MQTLDLVARLTCAKTALEKSIALFSEAMHMEVLASEAPAITTATGAEQLSVAAGGVGAAPDTASEREKRMAAAGKLAAAAWQQFNLAMAHVQRFGVENEARSTVGERKNPAS